MRKLLKKSMAAVLTASMAMSMTACAGKAVKPGSEESRQRPVRLRQQMWRRRKQQGKRDLPQRT